MGIMTRRQAQGLGMKWYFTGAPCLHGHLVKRWVKNAHCPECERARAKRKRLGLAALRAPHANRRCRNCQGNFVARDPRQRYCCLRCRKDVQLRNRKVIRKAAASVVQCIECGERLPEYRGSRRKYCNDACRIAHHRVVKSARYCAWCETNPVTGARVLYCSSKCGHRAGNARAQTNWEKRRKMRPPRSCIFCKEPLASGWSFKKRLHTECTSQQRNEVARRWRADNPRPLQDRRRTMQDRFLAKAMRKLLREQDMSVDQFIGKKENANATPPVQRKPIVASPRLEAVECGRDDLGRPARPAPTPH